MGVACLKSTIRSTYSQYFKEEQLQKFKEMWSKMKLIKIKKIFEKNATPHATLKHVNHLKQDHFCSIFFFFYDYQEMEKKRIFEIFDIYGRGYVDWENFYATISCCYFGKELHLAIMMFIIFDKSLTKSLTKPQLENMITQNQEYLNDETTIMTTEEIAYSIIKKEKNLTIEKWLEVAFNYFDFYKFRKMFSIFKEEYMERELIKNFPQWNNLFDKTQEKYISYIVNMKWFQAWKNYAEIQYGNTIFLEEKNPVTLKSIKTRKNITKTQKFIKQMKSYKILMNDGSNEKLIKIKTMETKTLNYDLIQSHFGDKPRQINNAVLQDEFQEILKPSLLQNRDYVFVSEKVWKYFNDIYGAFPEFRRTGSDSIQLYPKLLKIYTSLYNQDIAFNSLKIREVSAYFTIYNVLQNMEILETKISQSRFFYRTVSMDKWQELTDLNEHFIELTSEVLIFMVVLNQQQGAIFADKYLRVYQTITDITLGDKFIYEDNIQKQSKNAIMMGKTESKEYNLHFMGEPYANDKCITLNELKKSCILREKQETQPNKIHNTKNILKGIVEVKGLGFITSTILQFLYHQKFHESIQQIAAEKQVKQPKYFSQVVAYIYKKLKKSDRIKPKRIISMIEKFLEDFINFDLSMVQMFLYRFIEILDKELDKLPVKNSFAQEYQHEQAIYSKYDLVISKECEESEKQYLISINIPNDDSVYYDVVVVRFADNFSTLQPKRYSFSLRKNSTLRQYKDKIQNLANLTYVDYVIVEVNGKDIVKNYSQTKDAARLQEIELRDQDKIYIFQVFVSFQKFIINHYSFREKDNLSIRKMDFKVGQFVDCYHKEKGWIVGKVIEKQKMIYPVNSKITVKHSIDRSPITQVYNVQENVVAFYPSRSALTASHFHIKLVQRIFNSASNEMQLCELPLVVIATDWMRWKEFSYLVYLQLHKFILPQYRFEIMSNKVKTNNNIFYRFQKYLKNQSCPYRLNITNVEGRCIKCYKFIKSTVLKGEGNRYCMGCSLNEEDPICWQIPFVDVMVCADWKNRSCLRRNMIRDHPSFSQIHLKRKKSKQTINRYILKHFEDRKAFTGPNILIVVLNRVQNEKGFKKIISREIGVDQQQLTIKEQQYRLIGMTTINSDVNYETSVRYRSYVYIQKEKQWIEYIGQSMKKIKFRELQNKCGLVFYFKKVVTSKSQKNMVEKNDIASEKYVININGQDEKQFKSNSHNKLDMFQFCYS